MIEVNSKTSKSHFVELALQKLESHSELRHCGQSIRVEFDGSKLILDGQLPSFHLKQMCQEILRDLNVPISNAIRVVRTQETAVSSGIPY